MHWLQNEHHAGFAQTWDQTNVSMLSVNIRLFQFLLSETYFQTNIKLIIFEQTVVSTKDQYSDIQIVALKTNIPIYLFTPLFIFTPPESRTRDRIRYELSLLTNIFLSIYICLPLTLVI